MCADEWYRNAKVVASWRACWLLVLALCYLGACLLKCHSAILASMPLRCPWWILVLLRGLLKYPWNLLVPLKSFGAPIPGIVVGVPLRSYSCIYNFHLDIMECYVPDTWRWLKLIWGFFFISMMFFSALFDIIPYDRVFRWVLFCL